MKKIILTLILLVSFGAAYAAGPKLDSTLRAGIQKYKNGNYSGCIQLLEPYTEDTPSSLAYYYLAMAYTQAGYSEKAIEAYNFAIEQATEEKNNTIKKYAQYGKKKIENPEIFEESDDYSEIQVLLYDKNKIPKDLKEDLKLKHLEYLRNEINNGITPNF